MSDGLPLSECHSGTPATCRAAVLTPRGRGAVATVIVAGVDATTLVQRLFQPASRQPLAGYPCDRIVFGYWQSPSVADHSPTCRGEELVVCRRTPALLEIHCHGGTATVEQVLASLKEAGCQTLSAAEWTLETAADRFVGEARLAMAQARTLRVAGVLFDQYRGALSRAVRRALEQVSAGEFQAAQQSLRDLLVWSKCGLRLIHPWSVVLVGKANAGKSSLSNALLGYPRSLVDGTAGTTRDVLTAVTAVDGWPVELADTAGSRTASNEVEREGIARAEQQVAAADLVLVVSDASAAWTREDERWLSISPSEPILLHNKSDRLGSRPPDRPTGLATSALTGAGLPELLDVVAHRLVPHPPPPGTAVPFLEHHRHGIHLALQALTESAGARARRSLEELLTVSASEIGTVSYPVT